MIGRDVDGPNRLEGRLLQDVLDRLLADSGESGVEPYPAGETATRQRTATRVSDGAAASSTGPLGVIHQPGSAAIN